jgi:photosystem II stability/assembly factor-like uncharacterized protein
MSSRVRRALALVVSLALASTIIAAPRLFAQKSAKPKPASSRAVTIEDLKGLKWRSVGPANMGGRIAAIALAPGNSKTFYIGYGTGGVWKTENLGVTFTSVFDKTGQHSVGAIAVADAPAGWPGWEKENVPAAEREKKGKAKIVWVGTGEGNGRNSSSWGGGVYRSTDAGASFQFAGLKDSHDIPRLAVDPRNPDVVYVAALGHLWGPNAERGVYKTTDGGRTWKHALKIDVNTGACDVVVDPLQPDRVYAAMYARRRTAWSFTGNSEKGGIFRSEDGGATWKKLAGGLPARTGRIGLAVFAKDSKIVYATVESDLGGTGRDEFDDRSPSGGVFRSEDHGDTWTRMTDVNPRPFYFSRIELDPANDQRVYVAGWDLLVSDDGGRHFRRSSEAVHVDFHAIAVAPQDPQRIFAGNDGGLYVSHDGAASWDFFDNVAAGQFYRVAVDMVDPYRIGGGLQDNGSWVGPSETFNVTEDEGKDGILNVDWRMAHGWDGFGVAFDPADADVVYVTGQGGFLTRVNLATSQMKRVRPSPREGQERFRFNWNSPFFVSKHDPTVLYHAGNRVFKLTDHGEKWFAISGDLSRREVDKIMTTGSDAETHGTVVSLAESPVRAGLLWAGTDDGLIHVTENEGGAWREVTPKVVSGLYVGYITASAHQEQTAYAAIDGHRSDVMKPMILLTTNLGRSWSDISGDLPAGEPVKVVIEDPASSDVLYCGTQFAAYITFDRGAHWLCLNGTTLPPVTVDDMVIHPRERDLVIGTHGRSIFVLDDVSMLGQAGAAARGKPLALFDMLPARPRLYNPSHYGRGHGIFRAKNPAMGAYINYWVREDRGEPASITIADAAGVVVRSMEGPSRPGFNRVVWDLRAEEKLRIATSPNDVAGPEQFVLPGVYKVTVKMGDVKEEKTVEVLPFAGAK